jgi:hypothetical protein
MQMKRFQGIRQFGPAYRVMFENDSHAPGSVDRVLMDNMIRLNSDTTSYLYSDYTPTAISYENGSRLYLENIIRNLNENCGSREELISKIAKFTSQLQEKCANDLDLFEVGGTEEFIIEHGSDWCTDVSRVGCALFQVAGIPTRLVYLINMGRAYSGHVIVEVFREKGWGAVDTSAAVVYYDVEKNPVSVWSLMNTPDLIDAHSKGDITPYTNTSQFEAAAMSNYYTWERDKYNYKRSGINDYYRTILEMSEKGWPGGLRWIHGESD